VSSIHTPSQVTTVSTHHVNSSVLGALIDGGANCGLGGADVCVILNTNATVDITCIGEKSLASWCAHPNPERHYYWSP
jgi:hypothetical protein